MQSEKVWFITGASRGFGHLWAEAALKRGDKVAATARNTRALDGLVAGYDDRVLPLELDVTDEKNVKAAIEQAHQHFGRLDIVLSNAGYGVMGAVEEASLDETRAAFETNVLGAQSVVKAAVPLLRTQQSGHILAVSSMAGLRPFPLGGVYVATKFALEGMMETLAQEVAGFGIKILRPHGRDSALRQWGLHLAARGGKQAKNKSVVAVARKLAVLLHHLWTTQEAYIPFFQQAA